MSKTYIITPVYNDRQSLDKLLQELAPVHQSHGPIRVVVVDDGSLHEPTEREHLQKHPYDIELIKLHRNVGHQRAIAIGLSHVCKQTDVKRIVVMDGDGEDRPGDIPQLLDTLGPSEKPTVVVAQRRKREENRLFKVFYRIYKALFRLLTGKIIQFGNFCAMTPQAAERLVQMDEMWMHFPATVIKSGLQVTNSAVDRGKRYYGSSKMNLVSLITHGLSSVAIFTESVLTRIILFCAAIAATSIALILVALTIKVFGYATPGWFTVAIGALLGLLVQTATIALISLLIAMNSRNTPSVIPFKAASNYIKTIEEIKNAS
ncbi:MAG: glycosyltransferase [Candidatus Sedimenticola sp. 20ELBAFRAG]